MTEVPELQLARLELEVRRPPTRCRSCGAYWHLADCGVSEIPCPACRAPLLVTVEAAACYL